MAASRNRLADLLLDQGRAAEALALAELVWSRRQRDDVPPRLRARSAMLLAETLWQAHDDARSRARARELAERTIEELRFAEGNQEKGIRAVRAWLDEHRVP